MVVTFFLYIYCYSSSIPKYIMSSFIEKFFFYHQLSHFYFGPNDPSKWEKTKQKKRKNLIQFRFHVWNWVYAGFFIYMCVCIVASIIYGHEKENKIISYTTTLSLSLYIVKRQVKILALQRQIIMICFSAHHIIILHHHNNTSVMKTAVLNLMNFICSRLYLNIKISGIQLFVASFNLLIVINCQ